MAPRSDVFHSARRGAARLVLLVAAVTTLAVACGEDAGTEASASSTTAAAPTSTGDETTTTVAPTSTTAAPRVVTVVVKDGRVEGDVQRESIELGKEMTLRVTSDVADEVHIHGYDLKKDVEAGGTIEIKFVADLPGTWEVELESSKILLVELQVA